MMRGYKQQFGEGSSIALSIDKLSERIEKMQYPTGPSRYYGIELVLCLKGGALFGGIIVATALLEIYVRGLVVHYAQIAQAGLPRKINPERELEGQRFAPYGPLAGVFRPRSAHRVPQPHREYSSEPRV